MYEKKKAIIALWGPQGKGKTTTLRKLAQEFLKSIKMEEDLQVVFSYAGKKIAISTGGDDKGVFEENTTLYNGKKWTPDILATPTRTKGPQNIIGAITENEEGSTLLDKLSQESQNSDNATTLRKLSREFLNLIEEGADIQIAFHYKGKRIVISTAGDNGETVEEGADLFKALKADILVTATRSEKDTESKASVNALENLEKDKKILTKAVWIYKSFLDYVPSNCEGQSKSQGESNDKEETEPLKESITKEQIEIIRNTINEKQAETIKLVIDNIIEDWEKKSEGNSIPTAPASK